MPSNTGKHNKLSQKIFGKTNCLSFDKLRAYSENSLSAEEHWRIENHLVDCDFCHRVVEGIRYTEGKQQLADVAAKVSHAIDEQFSNSGNKAWLKYATAAVLLIGLAGSIFYMVIQPPTPEQLFAEYFEPFPNLVPLPRKEGSGQPLQQAMQAYELERYDRAVEILRSIVATEPASMAAHFYLGVTLLKIDDSQRAIAHLLQVVEESTNSYVDYARWYLALGYLKQKDLSHTKSVLEKFAPKDSAYFQRRKELLKALDY